jgi:hypothetical protein
MADNETVDVNAFFEGLTKTLAAAIATPDAAAAAAEAERLAKEGPAFGSPEWKAKYQKSLDGVEGIVARLDAFEKAVTSEDPDSLRTLIKGYIETAEATREALSQTMDNVAKLAGAGAVKKSIDGDDLGGKPKGDEVTDPKEVHKAGVSALNGAMTKLARSPIGSKLTIG